MPYRYKASKCIDILGTEVEAHYEYTVQPGERPQLYGDAPHPGCPPMVEDIIVNLTQNDVPIECPIWLHDALIDEDDLDDWLLEEATEGV